MSAAWVSLKKVKATLNLALVMCLSLWAYYIQIKGEFTDRRQAPAPISNQTVPSGEPCGAHICGHSLAAWHHSVLQESSTKIVRDCEPERSTWSEDGMMHSKISPHIYKHSKTFRDLNDALAAEWLQRRSEERGEWTHLLSTACY